MATSLKISATSLAKNIRGELPLNWMLIIAGVLIVSVFAMGGSSRPEVASLEILRPLAIIVMGIALMNMRGDHIRNFRVPAAIAAACLALVVFQLIPLPPGTAGSLAGRSLLGEIDNATGLGPVWRPMAMSAPATLNAFWALLVPLSMFLISIQLSAADHMRLLVVVLVAGGASAIIALLQTIGDPQGSLYLYDTTNFGSAVGLFANRNHQAVLLACLIPLIFAAVRLPKANSGSSKFRAKKVEPWLLIGVASAAFIVPLILITGSRSGLLMGVVALASLAIVLSSDQKFIGEDRFWNSRKFKVGLGVASIIALILIAIWLQRALAIDRLLDRDAAEDMRTRILPTMQDMIVLYQPWGVGSGAFKEVYKVHEPASLLIPPHVNQSHNDLLDIALTGGVIAIATLAAAAGAFLFRAAQILSVKKPDGLHTLQKAALVTLLILTLASISDYPLRTPALACLFVLAAIWAALSGSSAQTEASDVIGSLSRSDLDTKGS